MSPRTEKKINDRLAACKARTNGLEDLLESESSGDEDFTPEPLPGAVQRRGRALPQLQQNMREDISTPRKVAPKSSQEQGDGVKEKAENTTPRKTTFGSNGVKKAKDAVATQKQNYPMRTVKKNAKQADLGESTRIKIPSVPRSPSLKMRSSAANSRANALFRGDDGQQK